VYGRDFRKRAQRVGIDAISTQSTRQRRTLLWSE
jgi:hypothetical protein